VVLGGLEGIQRRLQHPLAKQRIAALVEALNYGEAGSQLILSALEDRSEQVQQTAYNLLRDNPDGSIQKTLRIYALASLKRRLLSALEYERLSALPDALNYGHEGLNLVIRALRDPSDAVQQEAYTLLCDRPEMRAKKALELFSSSGVNYMRLRSLLIAQKWQLADRETLRLFVKATGFTDAKHLRPNQISQIPCDDLRIADRLWLKYSRGKFGFSVQRSLWKSCDDWFWNKADAWSAFGDRVGWRVNHLLNPNHWKRYHELTFDRSAPTGHLPFLGDKFGIFTVEAFSQRMQTCDRPPE
jgi:hypothetical protein